jgi:hypothetical protein
MKSYSYELNSGYFVLLETFALHLRHMSHDGHQWGVVPIPGIFQSSDQEPRSYALLGYSNPGAPGFLNALAFILPLVALGGNAGSKPELVVSFSSRSIKPLTEGLYIDDGVMMYDPVEDWERVWYPVKRQLWPDVGECCTSAQELQWFDDVTARYQDMLISLPEDIHREEFLSYLTTMSKSEDLIADALRD